LSLGAGISLAGFLLTWIWVKDTEAFVRQEASRSALPPLRRALAETSFGPPVLGAVTQAGLVNSLNDGMIWGLLPGLLLAQGQSPEAASLLAALYPAVWGIGQLFTGKLADHVSRRGLLFWGMALQGAAILLLPLGGLSGCRRGC
jgi:MFS family permease